MGHKSQMGQRQPYGSVMSMSHSIATGMFWIKNRMSRVSPLVFALGVAGAQSGCDDQNPAFKEDISVTTVESADAKKGLEKAKIDDQGQMEPEKRSGDATAKTTDEASGTIEPEVPGKPGAEGDLGAGGKGGEKTSSIPDKSQESTANKDDLANDSPFIPSVIPPKAGTEGGAGSEGGVGTEGAVALSWKVVEFTQGGPGKVDILWVVDTSGSMSEEQAYLANNFNKLITGLTAAGHDFQTAVTTTDVCQDTIPADLSQRVCPANYGGTSATHLRGSFIGDVGRKVLKKGDPDLIQRFTNYTKIGVNGSGFEHGLEAARLAVEKVKNNQNEPLIRPDAFLAVIVVSDEEDDGIGLSLMDSYNGHNFYNEGLTTFKFTEDNMIDYLKTIKNQNKFSISAITPVRNSDGSMCSAPHTNPLEEGTQYIKAAAKSGGLLQSLCDTDWSQSLANLGVDLSAQITQINLPTPADPASIKVMANGQMTKGWTYNPATNAIKFNIGQIPPEGAQIYVGYYEKL